MIYIISNNTNIIITKIWNIKESCYNLTWKIVQILSILVFANILILLKSYSNFRFIFD